MIGTLVTQRTCDEDGTYGHVFAGVGTLAVLANATALQRSRATLRRLP